MGTAEELRAEQAHVDRAYARLEHIRDAAAARATAALATSTDGGQISAKIDRDVLVRTSLARRAALQIGDQSLCFGRLDTTAAEMFHIGRLSVSDDDGESLVVDWRAPIAESFYRATSHDPAGIARRRHLRMHGRVVVGIDDELLDRSAAADNDIELVGEAALLAALGTARTGRMGDIVATIQGEQDRAIRAPLAGVLVVQGGPGTGKTAVALHRAAYLLYAHRFPLATQGVLVVGPNPVFCRYVENVLPGLGETGVRLATPGQLVPGVAVATVDSAAAAAIKGDLAMVERLRAVLARHHMPLEAPAAVGFGAWRLTVTPDESAELIDAAMSSTTTYNAGRLALRRGVIKTLARQALAARKRAARARIAGPEVVAADLRDLVDKLRRTPDVIALLDRLWPVLTADQVVDEALADVGLVPTSARSEHDAALLDEASTLLGVTPRPAQRATNARRTLDYSLDRTLSEMGLLPSCRDCHVELRLDDGLWVCDSCFRRWKPRQVMSEVEIRRFDEIVMSVTQTHRAEVVDTTKVDTFGHAVIDEAQDLTPMQWRVIHRRCPSGSLTIVGDLGQTKNPWGARSWEAVTGLVAPEAAAHVLELAVNYRTPSEIMGPAAAVLRSIDPALRPPQSVRHSGVPPRVVAADAGTSLLDIARRSATDELRALGEGNAVIVLPDALARPATPEVLEEDVAELGVEDVKGLEFDVVVLVEPSAFDAGALYVALTRATARLVIVHAAPLPAALSVGSA